MSKKNANIRNPVIAAVVQELFRFSNEKQAQDKIEAIRNNFAISNKTPKAERANTLILWIKGFAITTDEEDKGYTGNYAAISAKKIDGGKYTLHAQKIESELKFHPEKKRVKKRHPDWGNPILRGIRKKKIYKTAEEAFAELSLLHEEYPEISIPGKNRLLIMIYEKREGEPPVKKYKLEVMAEESGGYCINFQENTKTQKFGDKTPDGYFAAMVKYGKKRPKKQ